MKWLKNKKNFIIVICISVICIVYFCAQKAIDNYLFNNNVINIEEEVAERPEEKLNEGEHSSEKISEEEIDVILEEVEEEQNGNGSEENATEERKIYVYITGEVNNPGVLILNEGSRIVDAINAAGGTTSKANISKVNLVYVLEDGMKVNIPNNEDLKNKSDFEYITMNSGDGESGAPEKEEKSSNVNSSQGRIGEF